MSDKMKWTGALACALLALYLLLGAFAADAWSFLQFGCAFGAAVWMFNATTFSAEQKRVQGCLTDFSQDLRNIVYSQIIAHLESQQGPIDRQELIDRLEKARAARIEDA